MGASLFIDGLPRQAVDLAVDLRVLVENPLVVLDTLAGDERFEQLIVDSDGLLADEYLVVQDIGILHDFVILLFEELLVDLSGLEP